MFLPDLYGVPLVEGCKLVKQRLRRTNLNVLIKVNTKIEKQWNVDFLKNSQVSTMGAQHSCRAQKEDKISVWTLGT